MKIGLIGCGNIGKELALYIDSSEFFELAFINDVNENSIDELISSLKNKPMITDIDHLIKNSDVIIESASQEVVKKLFDYDLKNKKILIMSSGGLINLDYKNILKNNELFIPTGAISGLDSLKAVSNLIESLELITTKPSKSLGLENKEKQIIFEGNVEEAVKQFPQNINVAATLKLATNFDPKITIISDPEIKTNKHEIIAKGIFGKLHLITENKPSKNPKTSYLAILSAIQCLKNIENNFRVGC
jgi:aspartate dehydrogenase